MPYVDCLVGYYEGVASSAAVSSDEEFGRWSVGVCTADDRGVAWASECDVGFVADSCD